MNMLRKYYHKSNGLQGACTVVRKDNKIGRNFDYYYDESVEFVTNTNAYNGRYKVIGTCGNPNMTKSLVENVNWSKDYITLPFLLRDGINEKGLYANINMLDAHINLSVSPTGSQPLIKTREVINSLMFTRYILDNFADATTAVEYIRDYVKVVPPKLYDNQFHWFIADVNYSYVLEIINDEIDIIEVNTQTRPAVLTNFPLHETTLDNDNYSRESSNIDDYGVGIERANIAINSTSDLKTLMCDELKYTNAYAENSQWLTEFVGINGATIHSSDDVLRDIQQAARQKYLKHIRNGETWHTVHTAIYDLSDLSIELNVQEQDKSNIIKINFN